MGLLGADTTGRKAFLRARFADAGWQAPRLIAGMDITHDFYVDGLRQVRMPRWSRGRVVLTGDAAWCVTPLGGMGATLAVVGAYVLAGELARTGLADPKPALAAYERLMRPMVSRVQAVPRVMPRLFHPRSRTGVWVLRRLLRLAALPRVQRSLSRRSGTKAAEPALPEYEMQPSG